MTHYTTEPYRTEGSGAPAYGYAPASAGSPSQERTAGILSHLVPLGAMVLSAGFLGFVGSLVIFLLYKDRGAFVRQHAVNSLNVQLTMLMWLILGVPLILLLGFGLLVLFVAPFIAGALHIVGAVKAAGGQSWKPPMTVGFVR